MIQINWFAVIIAAIGYFMLGALWFSPLVAGKYYDNALGFVRTKEMKWGALYYVGPFVGCLISSIATAFLMQMCSVSSSVEAIRLGFIVGVGYGLAVSVTNAINPNTPKPIMYGFATGGYHVLGNVLASIIYFKLK